jgi:hypothetical protein
MQLAPKVAWLHHHEMTPHARHRELACIDRLRQDWPMHGGACQ